MKPASCGWNCGWCSKSLRHPQSQRSREGASGDTKDVLIAWINDKSGGQATGIEFVQIVQNSNQQCRNLYIPIRVLSCGRNNMRKGLTRQISFGVKLANTVFAPLRQKHLAPHHGWDQKPSATRRCAKQLLPDPFLQIPVFRHVFNTHTHTHRAPNLDFEGRAVVLLIHSSPSLSPDTPHPAFFIRVSLVLDESVGRTTTRTASSR